MERHVQPVGLTGSVSFQRATLHFNDCVLQLKLIDLFEAAVSSSRFIFGRPIKFINATIVPPDRSGKKCDARPNVKSARTTLVNSIPPIRSRLKGDRSLDAVPIGPISSVVLVLSVIMMMVPVMFVCLSALRAGKNRTEKSEG